MLCMYICVYVCVCVCVCVYVSDFVYPFICERQAGSFHTITVNNISKFVFVFVFVFFPYHVACRILVPQPRIEPRPSPQQWEHEVLTTAQLGNS